MITTVVGTLLYLMSFTFNFTVDLVWYYICSRKFKSLSVIIIRYKTHAFELAPAVNIAERLECKKSQYT